MSTQKCKIFVRNATEEPSTRYGATINGTRYDKYFASASLLIENHFNHSAFYKLSSWIREQHDKFKVIL